MAPPAVARERLDRYGLDTVCEMIVDGCSLTHIANDAGVSIGSFLTWLDSDAERSARVREVRAATAKLWDERAEDEIRQAGDEFQLKKARELASHFRWRAKAIGPREYGDRIQHANDPTDPMPTAVTIHLVKANAEG